MRRITGFSTRQLASIVVAICACALLVPTAASAITGSLVTIADPATPSHKARVDSTGHLLVSDGSGPLTIDGAAQLAAPSSPFTATATLNVTGPTAVLLAQRRGKQRLAITSITAWNAPSFGTNQVVHYISYVKNSSSFVCPATPDAIAGRDELDVPLLTIDSTVSVAYPSPLIFFGRSSATTTSCLYAKSTQVNASSFLITTTLNGFWTT